MKPIPISKQTDASIGKNVSFFRDNLEGYRANIEVLDTYRNIRASANEALCGVGRLLDVGNGGTFDYDVRLVGELVAVDLFLEELTSRSFPENVRLKNGSALNLPEPDESFDAVILSMLIHHLVGKTVDECKTNVSRAIAEAFRVLKPGGKLIILESCVLESTEFRPVSQP
ncbi:MAG TPA: class I SAM-dependent methyltransferase [Candidatus Limnocylindrales bacterium]|nr:class I SAM-dependent methyltransferase [Candidatus Limnocylindrales bacterium]